MPIPLIFKQRFRVIIRYCNSSALLSSAMYHVVAYITQDAILSQVTAFSLCKYSINNYPNRINTVLAASCLDILSLTNNQKMLVLARKDPSRNCFLLLETSFGRLYINKSKKRIVYILFASLVNQVSFLVYIS